MIEDLLRNSRNQDEDFKGLLNSLSEREIEIMVLFAFGVSRKDAAKKLGVSPRTVDSFAERIKQKLGLIGNRELVQRAINFKDCLADLYKSKK